MRLFILIMLVAIGSSGATFLIVSSQKNAEIDNERANLEEKNAKEKQESAANKRKVRKPDGKVEYVEAKAKDPVTPATTPEEFIERLETVNIADKGAQRRVVHYMESLVDIGPNSLGAIRTYLNRNVDKSYMPDRTALFGSNTNAGPRGADGGRNFGAMAAEAMTRFNSQYDKNGDGKIDDDERKAIGEEMRERFQGFGGFGGGGEPGTGKGGRGAGRKGNQTNPNQ